MLYLGQGRKGTGCEGDQTRGELYHFCLLHVRKQPDFPHHPKFYWIKGSQGPHVSLQWTYPLTVSCCGRTCWRERNTGDGVRAYVGPVWTPESDPHLGAVGPAQFWGDPRLRQRAADPCQHTGLGADHWAGNKARCHQIFKDLVLLAR